MRRRDRAYQSKLMYVDKSQYQFSLNFIGCPEITYIIPSSLINRIKQYIPYD